MTQQRPLRVLYQYRSQHLDTGSPRALLRLIELVDRNIVDPWFMASGDGPLIDALRERNVTIVEGGMQTISHRHPLRSVRAIARQRHRLRSWKIDVVHLNELGWNQDLIFAAASLRLPVFLHVHLPQAIEFRNAHRLLASKVILVSEEQRVSIRHFHRIMDKAIVIHNPVDLATFASGKNIRDALSLRSDQRVVGTIAQIRPNKGIVTLVETARLLIPRQPKLIFLVVGPDGKGHGPFADDMRRLVGEPVFDDRVRFLGSRTDIADLLATFDVFFLPTELETLNMSVTEAMAASVPVVTSPVHGMAELIPSSEFGRVVTPPTAAGFAQTIEDLLTDPELASGIGARACHSLTARFDRASVSSKLNELYSSLFLP